MPLLDPSDRFPNFDLPDQHGRRHRASDYQGRSVIIYFYPKDDTPTCTRQACAFQSILPRLNRLRVPVLAVSPDDQASHARFAKAFGLKFPLLADVPGRGGVPTLCDAAGAWGEKLLYGRRYLGVVRTTYLIDAEGLVVRRGDRVRVSGHVEAVAAATTELQPRKPHGIDQGPRGGG